MKKCWKNGILKGKMAFLAGISQKKETRGKWSVTGIRTNRTGAATWGNKGENIQVSKQEDIYRKKAIFIRQLFDESFGFFIFTRRKKWVIMKVLNWKLDFSREKSGNIWKIGGSDWEKLIFSLFFMKFHQKRFYFRPKTVEKSEF